ncbi:MFS transporter [Streptomyces sp. NBC_01012]|uniref:MFS transporter n=1 Tax=Streptomyces sp. NBC_01012 TaxID=2903717 RepID=UPI003863A023|nr:MFS transporter [Streptomyces sp. NBC_01012]
MSSDLSPGPPGGTPYRWRWYAFAVVLTASIMDVLDSLVTTVAGPSIRADLGGSTTVIQWLTAGYTLAMAGGLIVGGRLGDIYGRKRMFMLGITGFTIGSVLCGMADSTTLLIVFRVLQGLFGAVLIPQGLGLIKDLFPVRELPLAFGSIGPVMGVATIAGPILGGWLIGADFFGTGWRMIFLINLPIGVLALLAAAKLLPSSGERTATRLDLVGAAIVVVAAVLMVFPVVQGRELGWPAWTLMSLAAGLVLFVVFARYESARHRAGDDTLVIPGLFRKRAFSGTLAAGALVFSAIVGFSLVLTLYIQLGLGHTPLEAALYGLPQVLGSSVIALVSGKMGLPVKLGRTLIHIGTAGLCGGTLLLWVTVRAAGDGVDPLWFAPSLIVIGVGMGLAMSALYYTVNTSAEPHESGSASGTFTAVQQFSGALGVAVLGTVFFGLLGGGAGSELEASAAGARAGLDFDQAFQGTLLVLAALYAGTFALAFLLPRTRPTFEPGPGAAPDGESVDAAPA